jgi:sentrin-specific protease 7
MQKDNGAYCHFFSSHFYTKLSEEGPNGVTSWTIKKDINIFTLNYIFIPVNLSLHWSLCVVVNPGYILNEFDDITSDGDLCPCIIFFDSLGAHDMSLIADNVRKWLNSEWQRLIYPSSSKSNCCTNPFTSMKAFFPEGG